MWKDCQRARRRIGFALLLIFCAQLVGTIACASVCLEPCPDESAAGSCPPVCSLCTLCTHTQQAIIQATGNAVSFVSTPHVFTQGVAAPSQLSADIFHVPLLG